MKKFSIIIPAFKGKYLKTAIDSVLNQSYSDFELVVYNDGSPDDISRIVKSYNDHRIQYYSGGDNIGKDFPTRAWNKAVGMSVGEYICLLGDDDFLSLNFLEEISALILKYPENNIFRSKVNRVDEKGEIIFFGETLPEEESWMEFLFQRNVNKRMQSTCEFVLKKEALIAAGGYKDFPRACGSDDVAYLLIARDRGVVSTNGTIAYWRKHHLNISDNDSDDMNAYKVRFFMEWERQFFNREFFLNLPRKVEEKDLVADLQNKIMDLEWQIKGQGLHFGSNGCLSFLKTKFLSRRFFKGSSLKNKKIYKKKVLYIGHSYHNKTKSNSFFMDYLKDFYDVEVLSDESWMGGTYPDLKFVDSSYHAVIFWQNLPGPEIVKKINNNNLVFFPMYDAVVGSEFNFDDRYKQMKIINFSKKSHEEFSSRGFNSMYIQYFPEPRDFTPGKSNKAFFWQRISKINVNNIINLFGSQKIQIYLHKAVDPGNEFVEPKKKDINSFNFVISDWFGSKEEMVDYIEDLGIYVAPREFEGIGMSFLEAMSMGKAVIAVDKPTMNEYIENNKNGYLYDLDNIKNIDFSNIEEIQKNAHSFIKKGYNIWMKRRFKIIDFIENK